MNLAQFARLSALEEFLFEQLAHLYAYVSIRQNTSAYATLLAQLVRLSALEEFLFEQLAHLSLSLYVIHIHRSVCAHLVTFLEFFYIYYIGACARGA